MNRYYLLLLLLIFATSCTNETVNETEPFQELTLKQVNYVYDGTPSNCEGDFADFNAQGKILQKYSSCNGNVVTTRTYTYNDNGLIESIIEGFGGEEFIYEDDVLVEYRGGSDASSFQMEFTYNGNNMISTSYEFGEPTPFFSVYEFEDDTYTKLLSIKAYDSSSGTDELTYLKAYQYEGDNPIEIYIESRISGGSEIVPLRRMTLTYDNKNNPYKRGLAGHAFLKEQTRIIGFVDYNLAYSANNNITSIVFEDLVQNTSYTQTYTYQYNTDMYPIEAMNFVNGDYRRTDYFEYY